MHLCQYFSLLLHACAANLPARNIYLLDNEEKKKKAEGKVVIGLHNNSEPCIYTNINVCIPYCTDWFITRVHDPGFTSPLSSLPPPSPPYELPFCICTRLSLSHLSVTPWRCYRSHFPRSLNKQRAGVGGFGGVGGGWDRHWIITSSHSLQGKNDGKGKKGKIKHDAAH